jgi:hypothetical protein
MQLLCDHAEMDETAQPNRRAIRGGKLSNIQWSIRRSSPVKIDQTDQNILDADDPQSEHWRGLQPDLSDRLLVRRSLVRAQVEEPKRLRKSRPCRDARSFRPPDGYWKLPISGVVSDVADRTRRVTFHSVDQRSARGAMLLRATDSGAMHAGDGTLDPLGSYARRRSVERAFRCRWQPRQAFKTWSSSLWIACAHGA